MLTTFCSAYLGLVGKQDAEAVFSKFWAARALGAAIMFFLSITDSVQIPLIVLVTTLAIGYVLYLTAECVYGERLSSYKHKVKSMCSGNNKRDEK